MSKSTNDHPHLLKTTTDPKGGELVFHFKPFTGEEEDPREIFRKYQVEDFGSFEAWESAHAQYRAAGKEWWVARAIARSIKHFHTVRAAVDVYYQAKTNVQEAWREVLAGSNDRFLGLTLALMRAHRELLEAADALGRRAEALVMGHSLAFSETMAGPTLMEIAQDAGMDLSEISSWPVSLAQADYTFQRTLPARGRAEKIVADDRADLRELMELAGLHEHIFSIRGLADKTASPSV